jgi:hypothetical protein
VCPPVSDLEPAPKSLNALLYNLTLDTITKDCFEISTFIIIIFSKKTLFT